MTGGMKGAEDLLRSGQDALNRGDFEKAAADFTALTRIAPRALLAFCGLDFEDKCLQFHEGERTVFTQSAAEVRRPLNAEGVGRWRRYEHHLAGFRRSLDDFRNGLRTDA